MTTESLLAVDDLHVHYRLARSHLFGARPTLRAVDGVSLSIDRGRTLGLVGESGCGSQTAGDIVRSPLDVQRIGSPGEREERVAELFSLVVQHICDEIAVMYLGVVVEKTNRKMLFRNPRHPYTRALLSAVPARRGASKAGRIRLEGDIPSPIDVPSGCRFHTRCAHAQERCRVEVPELVEKEPGHWEACHFDTSHQAG